MTKREQEERRREFSGRGFGREEIDIILDAEESCDRLRKRLCEALQKIERLEKELSDMVRMARHNAPREGDHHGC